MAVLHANNISTTLNGAISSGQTSITVTDATGMPTPTGGDYFTMTLDDQAGTVEIVYVTARSGTTLTVTRAREGTSDLNWPDLTLIENRLTADTIDSKITQVQDDTSPVLAANLDCNNEEILNCLRLRTDIVSKGSDTTNNITFTTSTQTFKPFNSDVMNLKTNGMQLGGANARVSTIYDTDTLSENSSVALATQQSIKAYVDSSAQQRAKAWATFDASGGAITILDSYNISSISYDSLGIYTVTFSTALANANYSLCGTVKTTGSKGGTVTYDETTSPTSSSITVQSRRDDGNLFDTARTSIIIFGDA